MKYLNIILIIILAIGLSSLSGCAANNDGKPIAQSAAVGAVVGALIGAAVGGKKGAAIGAATGAIAGIMLRIVIDEYNKPDIQNALEIDAPTILVDKNTESKYEVRPGIRYRDEGVECVAFEFINHKTGYSNRNNSACRGTGNKYDFIVVNDTLVPPGRKS